MERYRVVRIEEQMYGCEELPEGAEVCCDVTVEAADGTRMFFTDSPPFFYNNRRSAECFTNQTQFALLDLVLTSL